MKKDFNLFDFSFADLNSGEEFETLTEECSYLKNNGSIFTKPLINIFDCHRVFDRILILELEFLIYASWWCDCHIFSQ